MPTQLKFDGIYEGPARGFGCWFFSKERVPLGTVRLIRGVLFHCWMASSDGFIRRRYKANWVPCDREKNTPENWRVFQARVVEGDGDVVLK